MDEGIGKPIPNTFIDTNKNMVDLLRVRIKKKEIHTSPLHIYVYIYIDFSNEQTNTVV